jgi:tetratricopeptide (TPR) repeat protein
VNRQQIIITISAATIVALLFFFGRTTPKVASDPIPSPVNKKAPEGISFEEMLEVSKKKLTQAQLAKINAIEKGLSGADTEGKIHQYHLLSDFWKDSVGAFVPYVKYLAELSKLENSEKNLTFAAHLMLAELPSVEEPGLRTWLAKEAKELFEKAKRLNPNNDSTSIGLGSCYFFGGGGNEPPMKGIMLIRDVAEKDPNNIYAQYMLGIGASISGQTEKAIERFTKVVTLDNDHLEARLRLADLLVQKGDKENAKMQYAAFIQTVKRLEAVGKFKGNPEMIRQLEAYIETLK